jgi:hypothetical protein
VRQHHQSAPARAPITDQSCLRTHTRRLRSRSHARTLCVCVHAHANTQTNTHTRAHTRHARARARTQVPHQHGRARCAGVGRTEAAVSDRTRNLQAAEGHGACMQRAHARKRARACMHAHTRAHAHARAPGNRRAARGPRPRLNGQRTAPHGYSRVLTGTHGYSRVLTGTHGYSRVLTIWLRYRSSCSTRLLVHSTRRAKPLCRHARTHRAHDPALPARCAPAGCAPLPSLPYPRTRHRRVPTRNARSAVHCAMGCGTPPVTYTCRATCVTCRATCGTPASSAAHGTGWAVHRPGGPDPIAPPYTVPRDAPHARTRPGLLPSPTREVRPRSLRSAPSTARWPAAPRSSSHTASRPSSARFICVSLRSAPLCR